MRPCSKWPRTNGSPIIIPRTTRPRQKMNKKLPRPAKMAKTASRPTVYANLACRNQPQFQQLWACSKQFPYQNNEFWLSPLLLNLGGYLFNIFRYAITKVSRFCKKKFLRLSPRFVREPSRKNLPSYIPSIKPVVTILNVDAASPPLSKSNKPPACMQ